MATRKPTPTKMSAYHLELLHALLGGVVLTRKEQPDRPHFPVYYELTQEGHKPRYASAATVDDLVKLRCLVSADNVTFTLSAAARASLTPPAIQTGVPAEEQSETMQVATNEGRPLLEERVIAQPVPFPLAKLTDYQQQVVREMATGARLTRGEPLHPKFPVYWTLTHKPIGGGDSVILRKTCEYLERLGFIESTDHHIYTLSAATQAAIAGKEQAEEPKAEMVRASIPAAKPVRAAPKTPAKRPARVINAAKARKAAK